jgi:hypothetical protein
MLGHHTDRDFLGMVRGGMVSNCPVSANAVKNAHQNFGPDVGTLKDGYVRNVPLPRVPQIESAKQIAPSAKQIAPKAGIPIPGYLHVHPWV